MNIENGTLEALQKGDQHALSQLYDQYAPMLYGVALRISSSEEKAGYLLQETFRKIWKNAGAFDPSKGSFFQWALQFLQGLAKEARRPGEQPADKFDFAAYQAAHLPEGSAVTMSQLDRYMDEKHLKVIELAFFNHLSEQEIEEAMNIPVGTVSTRLRFSLRELRKVLDEQGAQPTTPR